MVYAELPSYGAWESVDIPDRYVFDICNCIYLLFCNLLGEFTVIVFGVSLRETLRLSKRVSVLSNILKRTKSFPLTVDSLQNPRISSKALVILIVCYTS